MSGGGRSQKRLSTTAGNIKLCRRLVQRRVQGYTILEIGKSDLGLAGQIKFAYEPPTGI
jgi:hypothetical protein